MVTDYRLSELVALLARWALGFRYRVVTAESCTGGWIAKVCTDAAGSSRWFECGYVTYSNEAKVRDLGVSVRTLEEHGAVSEPTVREMAAGALRVTGADISIAVSGIAGPDGGSAEKPVGTVWICVARRGSGGSGGGAGSGAGVGSGGGVGSGVGAGSGGGVGSSARVGSGAGDEFGAGAGARSSGPGAATRDLGAAAGPHAAAGRDMELLVEGEVFAGDRDSVRRAAVQRALELVLQFEKRA